MKNILATASFVVLFLSSYQTVVVVEYKKECGITDPLTKEDCISDQTVPSPKKCCYVEGHIQLEKKSACFEVIDTREERLLVIDKLETISTGVKVDCGGVKTLPNTCSLDTPNPKEAKICYKNEPNADKYCCFVEIKSPDYNGTACLEFPHLDINIIGQAVRAAETVNAKLKVNCSSNHLSGWAIISSLMMIILIIL